MLIGVGPGAGADMRLSARVDYALRAAAELAAADAPRTVEQLSAAQKIPNKYLESILGELRRGGLLRSQRGPDGGYRLARPAGEISIADVIRALDGELANVRGSRPGEPRATSVRRPRCRRSGSPCAPPSGPSWRRSPWLTSPAGELPTSVSTLVADPSAWI